MMRNGTDTDPACRQASEAEAPTTVERLITMGQHRLLNPGKADRTVMGFGADIEHPDGEGYISIRDAERSGHFGCFGTTRVGKTRLIENIIEQDIAKGYSVIVFDPKGDVELFSRIVQTAAQTNRLTDLMMLTPIFPSHSIQINPLASYYMQDELVNHIVSGIKAKEDYFISIATEVSQVVVAAMIHMAKKKQQPLKLSFWDIKQRIGFNDLRQLRESLAMDPDAEHICTSIDQIIMTPSLADFFSKVSSSLRTTLSALTFGTTGQIIGKAQENDVIRRLESGQPILLYVNTGSMLTRRTAHIIGKVMLSMIQSLVGRVFASGRKLSPPLCLHLDEGHNLLYQDIQELFSKGGGANCWMHFYSQSMAQITEALGPAAAQALMDNINTWVYMLVNHPDTAKQIEQSSPQTTRREGVVTIGGGINSRPVRSALVSADRVLRLPKRWFFLRSYGTAYKGRTLDTNELWMRVQFPTLDPSAQFADPEEIRPSGPVEQLGTRQSGGGRYSDADAQPADPIDPIDGPANEAQHPVMEPA